MSVDMQLLKKLREMTFAPLKDCKEALVGAEGDLEKAQDILKQKGISKAGKKADRDTNEGMVKLIKNGDWVLGVKLLCETDFVAKNETFTQLMDALLQKLSENSAEVASLDKLDESLAEELTTMVTEFVGKIGENVKLGDVIMSNKQAYVYNHPGNKVASIIYYTGTGEETAKELALQVAAMDPQYVSFDSVPESYRDELLTKFKQEVVDAGKPAEMADKIAQGKMRKALSESVLLEQEYIRDGSKKVKEIMPSDFEVSSYIRLSI